MVNPLPPIHHAQIDWQTVDGIEIPISRQFGDVYFSKANGLLETRHVFLNGNQLTERLAHLQPHECFIVGETGFGTGLNFLALWQLWQQVRPDNYSHVHFISVEKYPLTLADLRKALAVWSELTDLSAQLITQYPLPLAGCHRLYFTKERISLDLWLGDAQDCLPLIHSEKAVNAWFLDGFAPSCNPELWQQQIFSHIMRLSAQGTTFASFSVAGVLKRALQAYGVEIHRPKGFGRKREMLQAIWHHPPQETTIEEKITKSLSALTQKTTPTLPIDHVAIIGAGIAGLNCAWALAQRGISVTIFEQYHPLAGGSGNPLALLNPKLCPISQVAHHLMTTSWQYALRFYAQFTAFRPLQIYQLHDKHIDKARATAKDYPEDIYTWLHHDLHYFKKSSLDSDDVTHNISHLKYAGALVPHQFAEQVLQHPRINLHIAKIQQINLIPTAEHHKIVELSDQHQQKYTASIVIACNAQATHTLNDDFSHLVQLKPIRGQVSWAELASSLSYDQQHSAYSYGGYAAALDAKQLIFGASFLPHDQQCDIRLADHQHNFALLKQHLPSLAQQLPPIEQWQGRASLRAQTPDYLPLAGRIQENNPYYYTLSGLGSKGFLFAPLCSEIIASQILAQPLPTTTTLTELLLPNRFRKK